LDPQGLGRLSEEFYRDFIEKLARGKLTLIQTIVSHSFAQQITDLLETKGCINMDTREIMMPRLAKKLLDKEIDIEVFN